MSAPLVSICVPTWNGAAYLGEALESARAQTHPSLEVLVVDDDSDDGSLEIAAAFKDPRFRLHRNERRLGIPGNWNRCLALAEGAYVKFLFQDDTLEPRAVAALLAALTSVPRASLAFGRREIRHQGPELEALPLRGDAYAKALAWFYATLPSPVEGAALVTQALTDGRDLAVNVVGEPSFTLLRRDAALALGGFDTAFSQLSDWDLWMRLARQGPLVFVDDVLGVFRVHHGGASARNHARLRTRWEFVRLLGRLRATYDDVLSDAPRSALRAAHWRYRRHLLGEVLRALPRWARGRLGAEA
jgi:glycosyltransferase involved in cell wall biosynthesis